MTYIPLKTFGLTRVARLVSLDLLLSGGLIFTGVFTED